MHATTDAEKGSRERLHEIRNHHQWKILSSKRDPEGNTWSSLWISLKITQAKQFLQYDFLYLRIILEQSDLFVPRNWNNWKWKSTLSQTSRQAEIRLEICSSNSSEVRRQKLLLPCRDWNWMRELKSTKIEGRNGKFSASWTHLLKMVKVGRKGASFGGKVAAFRVAGTPFPLLQLPQRPQEEGMSPKSPKWERRSSPRSLNALPQSHH